MPDYTVFILRFCLFALLHSLFAVPALKRYIGQNLAESSHYRLTYNIASLALFAWVMSAYRHSPVLYFVPGLLGPIMYLLQALTLGMLFLCLKQTGIAGFFGFKTAPSATPGELITTGCYSMVRHPLYLFAMLFMILNPVMSAQWLILTILSAGYFVIGARIEERRLLTEHGDVYRSYRERVPFMVPRLKKITPPPGASV